MPEENDEIEIYSDEYVLRELARLSQYTCDKLQSRIQATYMWLRDRRMDHLAAAQKEAIKLLMKLPSGDLDAEMSISECDRDIWLGMGWLVGRGWVAYRGDDCYRFISESCREAAKEWLCCD